MKRHILIFGTGIIVLACLVLGFISDLSSSISSIKSDYEQNIGKEFILKGDTLTIVDYSSLNETYTLSNGVVISKSIVK